MDTLPDEIVLKILSNLDTNTIKFFSQTNLYYHNLSQDVYFWSQRLEATTDYKRIVFEELWADIKKYNRKSITGVDIFKNIIRDKVRDTLNYLDSEYTPDPFYISFLTELEKILNFSHSNIGMYMEKAVLSVIELYKFLKIRSSWSGRCPFVLRVGNKKGLCCNKFTAFTLIYCDRHVSILR